MEQATDHTIHATDHDRLARCLRASLGCHALRVAWELGALARRIAHEAPEHHPELRDAIATLTRLAARFAPAGGPSSTTGPGGGLRQGELF